MMEEQSEVAVSLDELTLDIALDIPDHPSQEDCSNVPLKEDDKMLSGGQEENINIEMTNENEGDRANQFLTDDISKHFEHQSRNSESASDVDDFEADIHPLSLFPRKRDDEEDSEFEFPDPSNTSNQQDKPMAVSSSSTQQNEVGNKTVHFTETKKEIIAEDTWIDLKHQENLDPEIFTPRSKVNSDLTTILQEVKKQTEETMSDNSLDMVKNSSNDTTHTKTTFTEVSIDDAIEDAERSKPSIVTTAEDWEQVQVVTPGFADQNKSKSGTAPVVESKPLAKFLDTWSDMASMNYDNVKEQIKTRKDRRGISAITHFFFGPPKLHKDLLQERDLIFCFAATKFDNDNETHLRVLQTVYRCLTGSKFDCQRYGSHWEEIGFQGQDPATDLRGGGILSLLHLLYFLREPATKELARDIYKLSLHPTQNFPFCVMSINISVMCLRVMREDVYNKDFNKRKDVVGTMNSLYVALYLYMYQLWKKGKTIHDSGYVLEEVANYSRKNSKNIFKDLEQYEKDKKEKLFGEHPSDNAAFFNVCKEEKCDDKTTAELY